MPDSEPRNRVFISLGSNIDAETNLPAAVELLRRHGTIVAVSTVYETLPVGYGDQPNFLNAAVLWETPAELEEVLDEIIPTIERSLGRVRDPNNRYGPRTIDVDVILYNDLTTRVGRHEVPDADLEKYPFVAIPVAELDPGFRHPASGETLATIAARFSIAENDLRPRRDIRLT